MEQSVLGGIIAQAQGDSGLASALRSSFNPLYGHQEAQSFPSEKAQTVFEDVPQGQSPEAPPSPNAEMIETMFKASKMKIATGNPEVDVKNYLLIQSIAKNITGLLG